MEYKGIKQFKVKHNWYDDMQCVVEINFDHPNIMDKIRQMVEFWAGWSDNVIENDGDYVKTFLQQCGSWIQSKALSGYNTWGIKQELSKNEGWAAVDGTDGINILTHQTIEIENYEFDIEETSGVKEFKPEFAFS